MEIKDGQTSTRVHKTPMSKKMTNPQDKAKFKIMQTKEIQHARLAMLAAAGMMAQELQTGESLGLF